MSSNDEKQNGEGFLGMGNTASTAAQPKKENVAEGVAEDLSKELFVGGPRMQEIEDWKAKYPKGVFFNVYGDETYVWRIMERTEYRALIDNRELTAMDREEEITLLTTLFPRDLTRERLKNGKAGIPSIQFEMVMDKSGFTVNSAPIKL